MEEKDKLRSFYDNVSSYLDIGSYDDFYGAMQDPSRRQKFFDSTSQYVDIGDSDKFNQFVGDYFGQQQPASRVDVSDVEAQQQPNIPTVTMEQVDNEPQQPYGDLTAENFVTMQQRGKELADQRKRIQQELDNDTEMEPLTVSQRKEYESQLIGLDEELRGVSSWIDEWNKTEGAKAYYEQQKRTVDDVSARIDQMQANRNRERIAKNVEEDNKKSWWRRMAEGLASAENPITEEVVEAVTDTDNNDLRAARNEVRNAKNQLRLEEMRQNGEQRGLGFLRGMENANYYELMPAIGMADAMSILQLSQDIKDGKELTDSQKLLKEAMEARAGVDFAYQDNNTLWERIGQSAPEQLMFTAQFVLGAGLTGATKVGEKVAAKSAERAVKRLAKKEATSAARNFVGTRVIPELEGMAVSSAIQTFANPLSVAGMVEDFEKRYAGDIYYDKQGNLHVFDNDRSAGQAAYQAIASAWIENFTEYAGGNITKSAKLLDSKMFDLAGKFDNVMKTVGAGKIQDVFKIPQQLGRLTQIGSAPEEFLEEELGSVMNALMGTDAQRGESYGDAFKNSVSSAFAGEQQLETFLSCAITSMLLGGGGNAVNGVRNAGLRKSVNQDVEQSKALLGKVRGIDIEGLDNMIENGRVSDISAYLNEQSDANNWNKDEQGAAVSYVLNRSRQIGVKHNDDTAIEAEQAEYRRQAEDMVNRWDGQNIYNVTYTDRNGETQEGTIVNGRVHYNTNEDGTYTFDPYMSSGMLAIRRADGSVEQVAGRNVTALNNVATIEEQLESQNQTIDQLMRAEFDQDGMLPTIESVWGGNLVPNVTQFQNGRYTYLGQDDNGLYAFANNDKRTSKDNPIIYLTERQLIEYGLSLNLENAQANGDTEAAQKAQEDIDFLKRLDEITADAGAKGQWDVLKAYAQRKVLFDANGDIIPDGSNEQATAAYLLAISEGSFENAIASVDQTIAALGTPQQTEVTDNAADNAAMNNAAATVDADKARQIDFYTNVRNRLTEMQQGKEEADQEEAEQVVANTPVSQMEVGQQFPVEWRGQQAMATVMSKDADGRSVVTVRDMNGEDIEAGIDDMSDAQWEAVRVQPQQPEPPMESAGNGTEQVQPEPAPQPEPTPQPQPTPTPVQPEPAPIPTTSDVQPSMEIPRDKDGKADYDKITDPYVYAAAVTEEFGDEAIDVVNALIESEEAALEGAKKIKDTIKRFREQRESKARLDLFNKVKDILAPQEQTETPVEETTPVEEVPVEQPTAETPVEEAPVEETPAEEAPAETPMESDWEGTEQTEEPEQASEQPTESVPDWTEDTAKAARERGYRMVDGERVDRQEPIDGVEGNEVEVKFSDTEKPKGKWKVVEAESLQPSHLNKRRNPRFFITEAQPKERKDNASDEASTKIAKDINPEEVMQGVTAYSGSPVINSRGEVIQGNNRTIGLQKMYESYPESQEKYKQALMDKAEQMGLDKEAIGKMQHPVLVRSVDVDDDTAIKLGQKTSQDTESGGKQRMGALQVRNGLGDKYANLIEMLFADTTEDEGIGEAIARNGVTALKYLWNQKVINNTQYQSALENGDLTAEAKEDFRNIIMESLFDGGPDGLRTAFNMLPTKSQNAILQTIYRDAKSNDESKIKGEVQQAIMAFANLMGFKSFAAAKNQTDVENAVNSWLGQQNMFSDVANTEKYSNFALELAKRFKWQTLTGQRAFFNELYDKLQGVASEGLSMFEEVQQLGLAEAIKAVYGIDYLKPQQNNGISGSNVVADDNGTRQEGEPGGTAETESGERAESGERSSDDRGGDERTDREGQETESGEKPWYGTIDEAPTPEGLKRGQKARLFEDGEQAFRNASLKVPAFQLGVKDKIELTYEMFEKEYADIVGNFFFKEDKPYLKEYYDYFITRLDAAREAREKGTKQAAEVAPANGGNTIFTEDEKDRRIEALKRRHRSQLNIAIDPQDLGDMLYVAGYHIEKGIRKFADFCKNMIEDLGDWVRPYLKQVYQAAKYDEDIKKLNVNRKEWSSEEEVDDFDVDNFDKQGQSTSKQDDFIAAVEQRMADGNQININVLRALASSLEMGEAKDTELQEMTERAIINMAKRLVAEGKNEKETFDSIVKLYNAQPTISMRSSERIEKQQYSTPIPIAYLADMFVKNGLGNGIVLEPSAGNGMMVFGLPSAQVEVNEIDPVRARMLVGQGFRNITMQDGRQPFDGKYDGIVTNPPFGSSPEINVDGVPISGLEEQMVINALNAMKDDGKAAIIIGGHTKYTNFGALASQKGFFNYLYSRYNVVDVINVNGDLYTKQGTKYPVRLILIDGRKSDEQRIKEATNAKGGKVLAPVKQNARAEVVNTFEELYNRVSDDIQNQGQRQRTEADKQQDRPSERTGDAANGNTQQPGRNGESVRGDGVLPNPSVQPNMGGVATSTGRSEGSETEVNDKTDSGEPNGKPASPRVSATQQRNETGAGEREGGNSTDTQQRTERDADTGRTGLDRGASQLETPKKVQVNIGDEKVAYPKQSKSNDVGTVVPAAQAQALGKVLSDFGDIDQFVQDELGYSSKEEMYNALSAEQVDGVALAIKKAKEGKALIIGDETGIGKGRQAAAMIRWAVRQGKKPVFVTEKPDLFSDIYRDLVDIGSGELVPFIVNAREAKSNITDNDGNVVYKGSTPEELKRVEDYVDNYRTLPDGYDFAVVTYSQLQDGTMDYEDGNKKARSYGKKQPSAQTLKNKQAAQDKRDMIEKLAKDNYIVMDEAHNAAGTNGGGAMFWRFVVPQTKAVTFLSATFAKRPENMPIFALKTSISEANVSPEELIQAIEQGGVTLQEIMSKGLVENGEMVRRAKSFEGVTVDWLPMKGDTKTAKEKYNTTIELFNDIIQFQREFIDPIVNGINEEIAEMQEELGHKKGTANMGVTNTPFASKTFNLVRQIILMSKVEEAADMAIEEFKAGRKPLIALDNTMEGFMNEAFAGLDSEGAEEPDFSLVFKKGLDGVFRMTRKDSNGNESDDVIRLSDLPKEGQERYHELVEKINKTSVGLSISPIDAIKRKMTEAGLRVGELTGRHTEMVYNEDGTVKVQNRRDRDKKKIMREFNNGDLDAIIINKSSSTGVSLHSNKKFKDQKPRTMIIAQSQLDVNGEVQMRGRINRTGQVNLPKYIYIVSPVPAEGRLTMMLKHKLASLDANTTSSQKSKQNEIDIVDFLNKYGDKVVVEWLKDNMDMVDKLLDPFKWNDKGEDEIEKYEGVEGDASKLASRVALLTTEEQERFYQEVSERYTAYIDYLNGIGQNDLEITTMPLNAELKSSEVLVSGKNPGGGNVFADNANLERYEVDVLRKPMRASEVKKQMEQLTEGLDKYEYRDKLREQLNAATQKKLDELQAEQDEATKEAQEKAEAKLRKLAEKKPENYPEADMPAFIHSVRTTAEEEVAKKFEKRRAKINRNRTNMDFVFRNVPVGRVVSVPVGKKGDARFYTQGMLMGYKVKGDSMNPSSVTAVFATLDSRRRVEIPLSMTEDFEALVRDSQFNMGELGRITLDNWDSIVPDKQRKEVYIITGNIIQAMSTANEGQLISFTTNDGEIKQGILMPDKWEKKNAKKRTKINDPKILEALEGDTVIKSSDGQVTIEKNRQRWYSVGYVIRVPKSKQTGEKYFLDEGLRSLVKNADFYQSGGFMVGDIVDGNLKAVLDYLAEHFDMTTDVKAFEDEQQGDGEVMYRDQEREYKAGEMLPITRSENGYRVEGLNDSFPNVDRLLDAWRDSHPDYFAEVRDGQLYVEPWNLGEGRTAKERRHNQATAERQWRRAHERANDTIKKLGLQDRVTILDSTDGLTGKRKTAKGWFDPKTGKIVIVMPNHSSPRDVVKTILHEGVAHYGLRKLVGEKNMNEFLDKVFEGASKEVRERIIDLAMSKYNRNFRKATEEYLAGLAEDTNFENAKDKAWFKKIKGWFMQLLHKIGIDFGNINEALDYASYLTDNELRYILWKSYRNLVADAESRTEIARDAMMQSQLGVGNYAPQTVAAESMAREGNDDDFDPDDNGGGITPEQDAAYMDAVNRGDMETAQRMVLEAAKAAMPNTKVVDENGNPLVVYRGTRAESPVRETGRFRSDLIFTSSKRVGAKHYGEPLALFINSTNPAILDYKGQEYDARVEDEFYEEGLGFTYLNRKARNAFSKGYDGLIVKNVKDGTDYTIDEYIVKNGSQIKSADPVTYDDQGNVIPLSQRFNEEDDDIRFRDGEPDNEIADEYNRETGANVSGVNGVKRGWEEFVRGMMDDMRPLEQMQKLIEASIGRELRDSEKAYELQTQLTSKVGRQIEREQLDYMVPMLQQVTELMQTLMENNGLSREEAYKRVNNYLLAKHGLERNEWFVKQGKKEKDRAGLRGLAENLGENPDDYKAVAERIVSEFEQQADTKALWKSMKALTDRMLEISYETGMINKDTFDDLKQRHKYYVPLRGFADGTAADMFDYVTQSPHFQNIFQKASGRQSMADDPLANLMSMLHSAIVIGNQNEVMQKIYNLAVNSKSDLLRITTPWYEYDDTTDTWEEKFPVIPEGATADDIDAIVSQFEADMQQKKAQGKAKRKRNRIDVGKKLLRRQAKEHEMVAYIDGKPVRMYVAGNPLVAQAMNKVNTQHLNKVMQAIQSATRWYSAINTSWSPAFGPKNAMRDIRMMLFGAYTTGGLRKVGRSAKWIAKAGWALPRLLITGKMDGLVKKLGKTDAAKVEQWWNEFLDNGGETGFTRTLNAEKAKGEVKDMIRHMLNGSKDGENRVRKYTIGLLEWIGRYSEDISRFAAYCEYRANGGSVLGSIQEAKNVTVNFNVHGGSDLAANCRALYSFFNASMQGINRMRRLATEHPKRFAAGISAMMLGGAVLPWLNIWLFGLLGGDDDDWRKYEELTEYTANHNMILYVGNHKFLSIPWSQELAPFNALGNIWFRQQMGWNKGKSVAEQWGDMLVDLSPISVTSGKKPGVGLVKTVMPSFTTPVWEAIFNEDFTGSPLYKDNQWNKYDASWEKAYTGKTSQSVIDASKWLDEKTGIDINPAIAEHLFSGVLGGIGRSGDKLLRYVTNGFQLQDAPFIRTMMFDSNPKGYIGAVQREYGRNAYEVLPKVKHDVDDMDAMEFARFSQTEEFEIANLVSVYKTGKDLAGNKKGIVGIDTMEKEYKKMAGMSDGSEAYREQLEAVRADITELKMEMLDEIQQIKYEHSEEVTLDNLFGLRKRIMDRVNEVEQKSKDKYKRRNGEEE